MALVSVLQEFQNKLVEPSWDIWCCSYIQSLKEKTQTPLPGLTEDASLGKKSPLESNVDGSSVASRELPSLDETLCQTSGRNMPTPPFRHNQLGTKGRGFTFNYFCLSSWLIKRGYCEELFGALWCNEEYNKNPYEKIKVFNFQAGLEKCSCYTA